ncbi:MAG: acyl-CoA thioesterase [Verrucomicrobia bacterium]|nr:acyl-CoA thioesterase [Verrucomicrobiota bacterium]
MFFDTDCGGVVHNIAYLRFIESNRTYLVETMGMGLRQMAADHIFPVLVRTEIDYKRPAGLGDKLQVEGWLESVERARFLVAFRITRPVDCQLIIECRQVLAVVQMPVGRPMRMPADWVEKYGSLAPQTR